jgi:hypothetical protein
MKFKGASFAFELSLPLLKWTCSSIRRCIICFRDAMSAPSD